MTYINNFVFAYMLRTVGQVDEDGERSWAVTLIVLAEDLEGQGRAR